MGGGHSESAMMRFTKPILWVALLLFLAGSAVKVNAQPMSQYGVGLVSQPAWLQAQYYLRITNAFGQGSNIFLTYTSNKVFIHSNTNFATNLITMAMSSNMAWLINTGFFGSATNFSIVMSNGAVQTSSNWDNGILQSATNYANSTTNALMASSYFIRSLEGKGTNNFLLTPTLDYPIASRLNIGTLNGAFQIGYTGFVWLPMFGVDTNGDAIVGRALTVNSNLILTNFSDGESGYGYFHGLGLAASNITTWNQITDPTLQAATNYANSLLGVQSEWFLRADWTNNLTTNGYILSPSFDSSTTTTAVSPAAAANNYLFSFTTTNQVFGFIEDGSVAVDFDALRGAGSLSINTEFYLVTNNVEYYEFASSSPIALTTTRTHYRSVILLTTNSPLEPNAQIRIKIRCVSQVANPTMSIFTGSNAISMVEIPTPAASVTATVGQPASANLTNWSLYSTNVIAETAAALDNGVLQSATNYANSKSDGVLQAATNYSHGILQSATNYTDTKSSGVLQAATNYSHGILQSATNYADSKDALILQSSTNYTDTKANGVLQASTNYSHGILQAATNYTDAKANGILQASTNYSDTKDALILQASTNYTDSLVTNVLTTISGTTNFLVDMNKREQFISATNTLHFLGTSNRPSATGVKNISFVIKNATGSNNTLYFNGSWVWLETSYASSATITNGKTGILALKCYGTAETDVIAAFAVQP